jgi:hypothetical protein
MKLPEFSPKDRPCEIAKPLKQAVEMAMACRTMEDAMADRSTMRMLARTHGIGPVLVQSTAMVTQAMEYFSAARRMSAMQCNLLAETLMDKYPHETLSDIAIFIRRAAMGEFDEGKSYGALDIATMMRWWRMHLDQKAVAMELAADRAEHETVQAMASNIGAIANGGLANVVRSFSEEAKARDRENREMARMDRLKKQLPTMNLKELREAWKTYHLPKERAEIQAQAARMGHLGHDLRIAQELLDNQQNEKA